jgi:hypothetical protein
MALSLDRLEVTSFETAPEFDLAPELAYTPPIPNSSPYCIPTELPDQCPETTETAAGAA